MPRESNVLDAESESPMEPSMIAQIEPVSVHIASHASAMTFISASNLRIDPATVISLRTSVAARVGIPDVSLAIRNGDARSFKWAIAAELLQRQGLTRPEIQIVTGRSKRWVNEALQEIALRLEHRAFREYFEQLIDPYDQMAAFGWNMRKNLKPGQSKEDAMKKIDAAEAKRARKAERNLQLAKGK
jgi:hypothetical protein